MDSSHPYSPSCVVPTRSSIFWSGNFDVLDLDLRSAGSFPNNSRLHAPCAAKAATEPRSDHVSAEVARIQLSVELRAISPALLPPALPNASL